MTLRYLVGERHIIILASMEKKIIKWEVKGGHTSSELFKSVEDLLQGGYLIHVPNPEFVLR